MAPTSGEIRYVWSYGGSDCAHQADRFVLCVCVMRCRALYMAILWSGYVVLSRLCPLTSRGRRNSQRYLRIE
jgi:hypothetical protein